MKRKCYENLIRSLAGNGRDDDGNNVDEEARQRYKADIEDVFTPDAGARIARNKEGCIMNTQCPTIGDVRREYGYHMAYRWLYVHITDAASKANMQQRPGRQQIEGMATQMLEQYFYLKLTELMLFFDMFKRGMLGDMYGAMDSRSVFRAMKAFNEMRGEVIKRAEDKAHQQALKEDRDKRVSWEQYCRMNGLDETEDPITRCIRGMKGRKDNT